MDASALCELLSIIGPFIRAVKAYSDKKDMDAPVVEESSNMGLERKFNEISWDDVRVFLVCAQAKSFRKAGRSLGLSSSTLVRRIARLERAMGTPLFDRVPDGLTLTAEGRAVLESGTKMELASFDVLRRQAMQEVVERGEVIISITEGLGAYWVMPRLVEFQQHYPFVIINLQCAMHNVDVLRMESDMAVQFSVPNEPDLIVVKLGRLHLHPFASQSYLDLYREPKARQDLFEHRFVQQLAPGIKGNDLAGFFGLENIDNMVAIRTNSSAAHFYAVEKGAGIGVLPTFAVALGAPVVPVDIGGRYHLDVFLTYHPDARKTPRRALAIDWLKMNFDPKIYPWFRDEFIHPSELVRQMSAQAMMNFGKGYFAVSPA